MAMVTIHQTIGVIQYLPCLLVPVLDQQELTHTEVNTNKLCYIAALKLCLYTYVHTSYCVIFKLKIMPFSNALHIKLHNREGGGAKMHPPLQYKYPLSKIECHFNVYNTNPLFLDLHVHSKKIQFYSRVILLQINIRRADKVF